MSEGFMLCCWIRGQPSGDSVSEIHIPQGATFYDLQHLLKASEPSILSEVDHTALRFYKPRKPIPRSFDTNLETMTFSDLGAALSLSQRLSTLFDPLPLTDHIHLIVGKYWV